MNEKEINDKIRTAVEHSVPDVFDSIVSRLEERKGHVMEVDLKAKKQTAKNNWVKRFSMVAATIAMIAVGIGVGIAGFNVLEQSSVDSVISFDVNPSIEMKVDKHEKVLDVQPLNEDGKVIIGKMDFKNTDLEVAVNALIGSMLKNGYISEIRNSILITVENKDEAKGAALQAKLMKEIDALLRAYSIDGAVVAQSIAKDDQLKSLANEHAITSGKAQLVKQLVDADPTYRFEELAKLSINELNLLVQSKHIALPNASTVGSVSEKAYIGKDHAIRLALQHAGVASSAVRELEVELDYDDGKMVYEVEFDAGGMEYEYEIDAASGSILSFEMEDGDDDRKMKGHNEEKPTGAAPAPSPAEKDERPDVTPATRTDSKPDSKQPVQPPSETGKPAESADARMSAADARKAVLDRFGGIIQKIEYNYDDNNPLYKGEALKPGHKVVFELNARTKSFKKWDVGNDNKWEEFSHALPELLTMDEAAHRVIQQSGKADTFVQKIDFLWDDEEPMYQGEAYHRGVKYSFEMDAYGGTFHKWDVDTGDETWEEKYYNVR